MQLLPAQLRRRGKVGQCVGLMLENEVGVLLVPMVFGQVADERMLQTFVALMQVLLVIFCTVLNYRNVIVVSVFSTSCQDLDEPPALVEDG